MKKYFLKNKQTNEKQRESIAGRPALWEILKEKYQAKAIWYQAENLVSSFHTKKWQALKME